MTSQRTKENEDEVAKKVIKAEVVIVKVMSLLAALGGEIKPKQR